MDDPDSGGSCVDTGDTSWVLLSTVLVLGMMPALAFFESGLLRTKNSLSVISQILSGMSIGFVMWYMFGFSLVFGGNTYGIIGNFKYAFFRGLAEPNLCLDFAPSIPALCFALFQAMFSAITPLLVTGAIAERMRHSSFVVFLIAYEILIYYPLAHAMWGGGFLQEMGALDFAGGIVIHTTAGTSSLVAAYLLGPRVRIWEQKDHEFPPHNVPLAALGAALLWMGWFGFNAGSTYQAGFISGVVVANTLLAASTSMLVMMALSAFTCNGVVDTIAILNGALAGLAGITPAAGYIATDWAALIGFFLGVTCWFGVKLLKGVLKIDDALDVSAVHGLTGVVGSLFIGVFADTYINPNGADGFIVGGYMLMVYQLVAVLVAIVWSGLMTFLIFYCMNKVDKLKARARLPVEEAGLDFHEHTRWSYNKLEMKLLEIISAATKAIKQEREEENHTPNIQNGTPINSRGNSFNLTFPTTPIWSKREGEPLLPNDGKQERGLEVDGQSRRDSRKSSFRYVDGVLQGGGRSRFRDHASNRDIELARKLLDETGHGHNDEVQAAMSHLRTQVVRRKEKRKVKETEKLMRARTSSLKFRKEGKVRKNKKNLNTPLRDQNEGSDETQKEKEREREEEGEGQSERVVDMDTGEYDERSEEEEDETSKEDWSSEEEEDDEEHGERTAEMLARMRSTLSSTERRSDPTNHEHGYGEMSEFLFH